MYSRYSAFTFDDEARGRAMAFWSDVGAPVAATQPGFQLATILESDETPGRLRTLTVWRRQEDFERFYSSDDHQVINARIRESGLRIDDRDGLTVRHLVEPEAGEVRLIRARVPVERLDEVVGFWRRTGRAIIESQPGCVRARAFIDRDQSLLILQIHWRSASDGRAFVESEQHETEFVAGLGPGVERLERLHLESIDQGGAS
ncbi:MAG: antibiotic biosynthesis monooxygenase [Gaiella sp.]|nr:antibiotic biosynthesis monooxygenase [Gaiella sp.]